MKRRWRLLVGAALHAPCILAAGCLPYVYPKLSCIPSTELGLEVSDVHAFRVDAEMNLALWSSGCEYRLTEITPRSDGTLPSQLRVTIEYEVAHLDHFYYFSRGRVHETLVRLYRPGYRLIELRPGTREQGCLAART